MARNSFLHGIVDGNQGELLFCAFALLCALSKQRMSQRLWVHYPKINSAHCRSQAEPSRRRRRVQTVRL